MENSSISPPSPAWPTRWSPEAFPPWRLPAFLGYVVGALLVGAALAAVAFLIVSPSHSPEALRSSPILAILLNGLLELPLAATLVPALRWTANVPLREIGFAPPGARAIVIALLGVAAAIAAANAGSAIVTAVTHQAPHDQTTVTMFLAIKSPAQILAFGFFAAVFAPIVEELMFRLVLFNAGLRYFGFAVAATGSSLLFGLAHGDPINALPLAMVGFVLCTIYYLSRNAWASMITHGCFNLTTLVALHYFPQMANP